MSSYPFYLYRDHDTFIQNGMDNHERDMEPTPKGLGSYPRHTRKDPKSGGNERPSDHQTHTRHLLLTIIRLWQIDRVHVLPTRFEHGLPGLWFYRDSIYCNTWTRNVIAFTAKRDSENIIDHKTRHVTWFLNDAWFTLSIVYYWLQNAIRFLWENISHWCVIFVCLGHDSELGVTQELALQSRVLHKSDISGASYVTCPGTYPSSRIPSSHWILSWSRSSFMDTITFLDSGEWQ